MRRTARITCGIWQWTSWRIQARWPDERHGDTTKQIVVAKVRCFLRTAFRRGWIEKALGEQVTGHAAVFEQKEPYTERELELILNEAGKLNGGCRGCSSAPATFRLLLELMRETGMRVSDAIQFDPALLCQGESGMWVYVFSQRKRKRTKAPVQIEAYVFHPLKVAIDQCAWLSPDKPFWYGLPLVAIGHVFLARRRNHAAWGVKITLGILLPGFGSDESQIYRSDR